MKKILILLVLLFSGCAPELISYHGHRYKTIVAGDQRWMAENLQTSRYRWGRKIPVLNDTSLWPEQTGASCGFFNEDTSKLAKYGMVYNWNAVENGKLCPLRWRVASHEDWNKLEEFLGGDARAGGKIKAVKGWKGKHVSGDDIGFNASAGGYRLNGDFQEGFSTVWWSSTKINDKDLNSLSTGGNKTLLDNGQIWIWGRRLENTSSRLWTTANRPDNGFYIRCVKKK